MASTTSAVRIRGRTARAASDGQRGRPRSTTQIDRTVRLSTCTDFEPRVIGSVTFTGGGTFRPTYLTTSIGTRAEVSFDVTGFTGPAWFAVLDVNAQR